MDRILLAGDLNHCIEIISSFTEAGFSVIILPEKEQGIDLCDLMVARVTGLTSLDKFQGFSKPWLAWCSSNNPELITSAYEAGATAAFSEEMPVPLILQIIRRTLENSAQRREIGFQNAIQRRYERGDVIFLDSDAVLEIQAGIIAQTMVYQDGSEVLLGLCGPNQLVVPHPADTCYIQLISHTDSVVTLKSWDLACRGQKFPEKLHARLQQLEAWAAMQARPHLDQRVLGILSLLAEQFGVASAQGQLVDVRITHTQLASAVGATRTTITRTVGDLRRQGLLSLVQTPDGERYCLTHWESAHHGFHF